MQKVGIYYFDFYKNVLYLQPVGMKHPIFKYKELIEERGLVVLDNITGMPLYGEPYVSSYVVIGICHSGRISAEYDMRPVSYGEKCVSVVYPNHPILTHSVSEDYKSTLLVISDKFYERWKNKLATYGEKVYHDNPEVHLNDAQYEAVNAYLIFIKNALECEDLLLEDDSFVIRIVELMSQMLAIFRRASGVKEGRGSIYNRFYDLLVKHYKESRSVSFYAEKMCLSPKYFGSLIKKETGMLVGDCISGYIILQAKTMLTHNTNMNIQQISQMLGFSDQAVFSRYFKAETGISPTEFRSVH